MTVATSPVQLLSALAEPLRWRIVELLASEQLCVCHLVEELDVPQPLVSHHLKALRDAGVVRGKRFRYWTYYSLDPEVVADAARALEHLAGRPSTAARRPCC